MGLFDRLKQNLTKSRHNVAERIDDLQASSAAVDEDYFDALTDILIMADVGVAAAGQAVDALREKCAAERITRPDAARYALKKILTQKMGSEPMRLESPMALIVVGVNGVGKTTSIGKLAARFQTVGRRVIICAADTFRAAAADQLAVWAERAGAPLIRQKEGADPAAVVFDGIQAAKARHADVLIIDTAGRLHNKAPLMEELKKISRVVAREYPEATLKALLVIDATTGQNGLLQAKEFALAANIDGIVLTKLDGTAKGGIALAIRSELNLPVRYIGIGEQLEDMEPFEADAFIDAIF
jgi:fused signal recognition particle receptor